MNIFKYSFLIVTLLSCNSLFSAQNPFDLPADAPHIPAGVWSGNAISGKITKHPSGYTLLSLYDEDNKAILFGPYSGPKTLTNIKTVCPVFVDTTNLTEIRDFTGKGIWNSLFGKKITE